MEKQWRNMLIFLAIIVVVITVLFFVKSKVQITGETILEQNVTNIEEEYVWPTWDHTPITYSYMESPGENGVYKCVDLKKEVVNKAFNSIEESTKNIYFEEVEEDGDIEIFCLPQNPDNVQNYYYNILKVIPAIEGNTIISGEIKFYTDSFPNLGISNCYENQMFAILMAFDFLPSEDSESVLAKVNDNKCNYELDDWITYQLDELYV